MVHHRYQHRQVKLYHVVLASMVHHCAHLVTIVILIYNKVYAFVVHWITLVHIYHQIPLLAHSWVNDLQMKVK